MWTKRDLFSVCGKLVGHYPVCGWLRVACSFVKRLCVGSYWNDGIGDEADYLIREIIKDVIRDDPVGGIWHANVNGKVNLYTDASNIASAACILIDNEIIEDAAWIRPKADGVHINVAELNAVIKGMQLIIEWKIKRFTLYCDSQPVVSWINSRLSRDKKVKITGIHEILIKRRLDIIMEMCKMCDLSFEVVLVKSENNRADVLTRVRSKWLMHSKNRQVCCVSVEDLVSVHNKHHFGVDRTLYFAKLTYPSVTREEVEYVVRNCGRCVEVDPHSIVVPHGELSVEKTWWRLALDITRVRGIVYLTMIDCGPGRFAIWKRLKDETACSICKSLSSVIMERGAVQEILIDNSTAFRSMKLKELCEYWRIVVVFRCAH